MEEHVILSLAKYDEIKKEITDLKWDVKELEKGAEKLSRDYANLQEEQDIFIRGAAQGCHISSGKVSSWVLSDLEEIYGLPLARKIVDYANLVQSQKNEEKGERK